MHSHPDGSMILQQLELPLFTLFEALKKFSMMSACVSLFSGWTATVSTCREMRRAIQGLCEMFVVRIQQIFLGKRTGNHDKYDNLSASSV